MLRLPTVTHCLALVAIAGGLAACAAKPTTEVTHPLVSEADVPYDKLLIICLFDSFDARRYLEDEIVKSLAAEGTAAVASTSMMDSRTPLVRQTFIDMIDEIDADGVLLTQLTSHGTDSFERDARPEATYNYWPTYYWNVFEVELTEYVEPPRLETTHDLVMAAQVFSVKLREAVWGMESRSVFTEVQEDGLDYQVFIDEAEAISGAMKHSAVIAR